MLGIFYLLILWLRLDWCIGMWRRKQQQSDALFPVRSGEITFFDDGLPWMSSLCSDCLKANHSIRVMFFTIRDDSTGHAFMEMLAQKAAEGVAVTIVVDAVGSAGMKKWRNHYEQKQLELIFSRPLTKARSLFGLQWRNHQKLVVIDERIVHVGGSNIGREYVHEKPPLSPWRDYQLRITGEGVRDALEVFGCAVDGKGVGAKLTVCPLERSDLAGYRYVTSREMSGTSLLAGLIDEARDSLFVGSPYFIPPGEVMKAFERALGRGVRVTLLVPGIPDHALVQPASLRFLRRVVRGGGMVYQFEAGFYHGKAVVVDGRVGCVGTMNVDVRSCEVNDEVSVVVWGEEVLGVLEESVGRDLMVSRVVRAEDLGVDGLGGAVRELCGRAVGWLL